MGFAPCNAKAIQIKRAIAGLGTVYIYEPIILLFPNNAIMSTEKSAEDSFTILFLSSQIPQEKIKLSLFIGCDLDLMTSISSSSLSFRSPCVCPYSQFFSFIIHICELLGCCIF